RRPEGTSPFRLPSACPSCGQPVVRQSGEAATRCVNPSCPAQIEGSLLHFSRRFAMDIDHLGESLIHQLVRDGLVASVADLYLLDAERLEALERIGRKSAENVVRAIAKSKARPLSSLL